MSKTVRSIIKKLIKEREKEIVQNLKKKESL